MHASALFVVEPLIHEPAMIRRRKPSRNAPRHLRGTQASLLAGAILTQIVQPDQIRTRQFRSLA
jgi:hypothetical protein